MAFFSASIRRGGTQRFPFSDPRHVGLAAGALSGNKDLEKEGALDRASGAVKEGFGTVKRKLGEALEDTGKHTKR